MLGFMGIPDLLPYFNLINHNTFFGIFLGAGGVQATYRFVRDRKRSRV